MTLLIDADVGLRNLDLLLGLERRMIFSATEVFAGELLTNIIPLFFRRAVLSQPGLTPLKSLYFGLI